MADGGFDPCECIFNHEMAMRRLLSLLRQSQSYCTDNECTDGTLPGPSESTGGAADSFLMMTMIWAMLAIALYLFRPSSLRNQGDQKPSQPPGGGGNNDPEPPAVM